MESKEIKRKCYVVTVSRSFPKGHKNEGKDTNFVKYIFDEKKIHTIRGNYDLWEKRVKEVNEGRAYISLRYWEGMPYKSKQIEFTQLTKAGIEKVLFLFKDFSIKDEIISPGILAMNDGLSLSDFGSWFEKYASGDMAIIHFTDFRYKK